MLEWGGVGTKASIFERATLLRDAVFASDDGIITTFAVVAGATGAQLAPRVVLILGFANLVADGFSMATGIYMGAKSESELEKAEGDSHWKYDYPLKQGIVTYLSFILAGFLPLIPFLLGVNLGFDYSVVIVGLSLFMVGVLKGLYSKKMWFKSGLEVLLIGGAAAFMAYFVGHFVDIYLV